MITTARVKPWGKEAIIERNEEYCIKHLFIDKGHRISLQYHKTKIEHMVVVRGEAHITITPKVNFPEETKDCFPGDCVTIPPEFIHRILGVTDVHIIEVAIPGTPDKTIRIEDDYGRVKGATK